MRLLLRVAGVLLIVCALPRVSHAAQVHLRWNANAEANISGYKLYWGTSASSYQYVLHVGNTTDYDLKGLIGGVRYFFAVTAYNNTGYESKLSNSVSADVWDSLDSDHDGLSDADEAYIGSNPRLADTDADGILDGQEWTDGSSPIDRGSKMELLGTTVCAEWNGFLDNLWNVLELVNVGTQQLHTSIRLYDEHGDAVEDESVTIEPRAQTDVLVHNFPGRARNSYGLVCVSHDGQNGDLNGRMVYYREAPSWPGAPEEFQFAYALSLSNGQTGEQYVTYNTFQPSFAPEDAANTVANWIQVTNLGDESAEGALITYGQQGIEITRERLSIAPRQRIDVAAHEVGESRTGLVRWVPDKKNVPCLIRNARYLYDNPLAENSFASAFSIDATAGSGQRLTAPVDTSNETSVLEIANTAGVAQDLSVAVYTSEGRTAAEHSYHLEPFQSQHLIVNELLPPGIRGTAAIKGKVSSSVFAIAMEYERGPRGKVNFMYGVPARESTGVVLQGSYNTFLNQTSELLIANASGKSAVVSASLSQPDDLIAQAGNDMSVSAHALTGLLVNNYTSANRYGVATVQAETVGEVLATLLRRRGEEYLIPIPLS